MALGYEGLAALWKGTCVRSVSSVRSHMRLKIPRLIELPDTRTKRTEQQLISCTLSPQHLEVSLPYSHDFMEWLLLRLGGLAFDRTYLFLKWFASNHSCLEIDRVGINYQVILCFFQLSQVFDYLMFT